MTIAQQLEQKGRKEGILIAEQRAIARGEQLGITLGRQKMKRTTACNMLQHGFDYDMVMKVTGLSMDELVALNN
jgi:predicted transposase/invertase (TIGR01784 family)